MWKNRGKCRKIAARFVIYGEIMPVSRGRLVIGDMLFYAVRSNYFYSKAFTTKASRHQAGFPKN
jgi:hypothetical protein